jgi:hypothetical protein
MLWGLDALSGRQDLGRIMSTLFNGAASVSQVDPVTRAC